MNGNLMMSSKSLRNIRRQYGERNARPEVAGQREFFDINRQRIEVQPELRKKNPKPRINPEDPYAHLGPIGYKRNTYQFRGENKKDNNIYGSQHIKKTCWLEEMRRRVIAERQGISSAVDETSVAGKAELFYLQGARDHKNKYFKHRDDRTWTSTSKTPSQLSSKA